MYIPKSLIIVSLLFSPFATAIAEVIDKASNGFVMKSSVSVTQSPQQAYQQFLRIDEWWDPDHSWFGDAKNFTITAQAGGCFCEADGERQVEHMRVVYVEPNKELRMLGGLGPLQMMGVHGAMSWKFDAREEGGTTITHTYTVSGYVKDGLDQLAEVVDKVQTSQLMRLQKKLVEQVEQ